VFPAVRQAVGAPPQCVGCKSVERHRLIRELYIILGGYVKSWKVFQFSPDRSVEARMFATYESSLFNDTGGVDMQSTAFADGAFNLVISNHVLEHVGDDLKALNESLRIVGDGVVHVCIPSPIYKWQTEDWGFADATKNYHYRIYGADFPIWAQRSIRGALCCSALGRDPVTGRFDFVYFLSRSTDSLRGLAAQFQHRAVPVCRYW
jgi:SAM-dependent methyltransferase